MLPRRLFLPAAMALLAAPAVLRAQPAATPRPGPPHEWLFGSWTGGIFPATESTGARCFGNAIVIFMPDVVMRASSLDVAFRQRAIETVALTPEGVEVRLIPLGAQARNVPEVGFGCDGNPDLLRVHRRGPDEIIFAGCVEFPSALRRCRTE